MTDKASAALCRRLKEAISDERAAPPMYEYLIEALGNEKLLNTDRNTFIRETIEQEKSHEVGFVKIANDVGCGLSTREKKRTLYSDLPLPERVALARRFQR